MKYTRIIGIDPGASGAVSIYERGKGLEIHKMPMIGEGKKKVTDIKKLAKLFNRPKTIVFVEKVSNWRQDTDEPGKRFGIAKMMKNYDAIIAACELTETDYLEIHPRTWQKALLIDVKGVKKQKRKALYKEVAKRYFTDTNPTLQTADSLCILRFGMIRVYRVPEWVEMELKKKEITE